jgi:Zn-dependent protease
MRALRLGRILGIEVKIDASAAVILGLIAWLLAEATLPELADGYTTAEYWIVGAVSALGFFASLLAHEMSHSVVARRRGIKVRDITLWLFGGVATIEGEPRTPRDEFAVAFAGPAMSIGVGAAALAAGSIATAAGASVLVVAALAWLGTINLVLAVFNLVPAAPLDGGRVLRAWLWQRHGDHARAARTAARAGEIFARVLIGIGVVELWFGLGLGGIWSILLGWFLLGAARSEEEQVDLEERLAGYRVRDVMTPQPLTAPASISVAELLDDYVLRRHCSAFPLVDATGRVVGLATLARARAVPSGRRAVTPARDVAWPVHEVTTARPDEAVMPVLRRAAGGDGRVLVFDGERLVGIMSPSDIARVVQVLSAGRPLAATGRSDSA